MYCLYFCSFSIEIVWHMSPLLLLITCYVSENSQFGIWNLSPALIIHFILTNRSIGKNDNTPCQNITCMRLWRDFYGVLFDTSKIQFSQKWNERRSKSFEYFKYFQFLNFFWEILKFEKKFMVNNTCILVIRTWLLKLLPSLSQLLM